MMGRHLYYVEPMGLGSPEIEALSSYMIRLSIAHCATLGLLLSHLSSSELSEGEKWRRSVCSLRTATYIRPNATNEKLVALLGAASTVPKSALRSMTFLSLYGVLKRSMNEFAENPRWCRCCLRDWKDNFQTPYFKLVWQLKEIETCPLHRCKLTATCAQCGSFQDSCDMWSAIDTCCHCGAFLGGHSDATSLVSSWTSHAPELRELVALIGTTPDLTFHNDAIRRVTEWFCAESIDLSRWPALADPSVRRHIKTLANNTEKIFTLRTAVEVSRLLQIRLTDLLQGRITGTNQSLPLADVPLEDSKQPRRRRVLGTRAQMTRRVKAFVESFPPHQSPSLREVARQVGASVGGLRHLLPAQCLQIARQHKLDEALLRTNVKAELYGLVLRIIVNWDELADGPMSKKAIWRRMLRNTTYPKNIFRLEIARLFGILEEDPDYFGKIMKIDRVKPPRTTRRLPAPRAA